VQALLLEHPAESKRHSDRKQVVIMMAREMEERLLLQDA
jgi:hypothetical protein